ncbi:MAG: hypothetical protein J6K18_01505 [Bacilli bacterium]|nr:hypothetical protein [Bacilli bacterium]
MKKNIRFLAILMIAIALVLIGCENNLVDNIIITPLQEKITLNVDEVLDYDYKSLFTIKSGTSDIEVKDEYLDISNLKEETGTYIILCTYEKKMASIYVEVIKTSNISLTLTKEEVIVNNLTVFKHDYKQYFTITKDNINVEVKDEYLDLSNLRMIEGIYKVVCKYEDESISLSVKVEEVNYQIKLNTREITIKQSEVENYDFNQLFIVVVDGKIQPITPDMVNSNVTSSVGVYQYIVSLGETSMTLNVNVISDHEIEIINSYTLKEIELDELSTFDYTSLFSIYLDGVNREVTSDMIDLTSLSNPIENEIYEIKITYTENQAVKTGFCKIKVIPNSEIIITHKDLIIYPNSSYIDLTTLFTITKNNIEIPVTLDMINGEINYAEVGKNIIKLNYLEKEVEAVVEVKQGVIINYAKSDVIEIAKGTSKENYNFAADFIVIVNGINFTEISDYIKTDNVDFNTLGSYTVTIEVPYTDTSLGAEKGNIVTKKITYNVVKTIYNIKVLNETLVLKADNNSFDAFENLSVKINGVNQKLTKIASQASTLATYAEVITTPDFNAVGYQEILVDVYVNGPENDPVRVSFNVVVEADVKINVNKTFVFEGETVYTKDIFTVLLNGENVDITQEMIEGKINTNVPGVYPVKLEYKGFVSTVDFIVLNLKMVGVYDTLLTTIPTEGSSDEDGYEEAGTAASPLKKLYITADGQMSVNGSLAEILYGIDENTMYIKFNNYEFTLSYNSGIVVIDPNNDLRMPFIEDKRPLIYFNEEIWELKEKVVINISDLHILQQNYSGYSFDIFNITNKVTSDNMWYALKINLYEKITSDYKYIVNHGEVVFGDNFALEPSISSEFTYLNETYKFTMTTENAGKINSKDSEVLYKYANKTFTTTYNGETAVLSVDQNEGFYLKIGAKSIFSVSGAAVRNQKYGGLDYENDIAYIYSEGSNSEEPFSYKLILNLDDNTFTILEKNTCYGRYVSENMYIFLDGYGMGLINYDKKQFAETTFEYNKVGNLITLTYVNINPSFEYGTKGELYIDAFNNSLTVKYLGNESFISERFINAYIKDGAVVEIAAFQLKQISNKVLAKKAFYDNITIITKDGVITDNTIKKTLIYIDDIDFATKGIYYFSITASVNGADVTMRYAIQII